MVFLPGESPWTEEQINKIRNYKGKATADSTEIPKIIGDCCEQMYTNKIDNLEEMDIF